MKAAAKKSPKAPAKAGKTAVAPKASKSAPAKAAKPAPKAPVKAKAPAKKTVANAKPAAKTANTPAAKPSAKAVTPAKAVKPSKTVAPAKAATAKKTTPVPKNTPAPKASVKAPVKPAAKAAPKTAPKVAPTAPVKATTAKTMASKPAPAKSSAKVVAPAPVAAPAPQPAPPTAQRKPAGTRKSALMAPPAPTLAPASGAKASFLPHMSVTIAPPPQVVIKKDPKLANNWKTKDASALSDAEVLAMPDSEYMNDKQMAFFRHKLVLLKQSILTNADETTEHLREDTVIVPDPADRATIEEEHALELRTRDRERKLLKKIEQSISRIDADDYGYCDETGEPIGVGRLIARPTATLSLEAQQRRELKQRMFGD